MGKPKSTRGESPEQREARARRRALRRESRAKLSPKAANPPAQLDHASNPKGTRNRRRGEEWLGRQPEPDLDDYPAD